MRRIALGIYSSANCYLIICAVLLFLCACNHQPTLFQKISSAHSGIHFSNDITETDSINPMDVVNVYNGGGIGIGDFNNDGLQDIYFTGNMVSSKLYLNKGNFEFEDITEKAGVEGLGRWARGVAVIDINNDGLMDLYICNTIFKDSLKRTNILYVNQGLDKEGIPHFKDMAREYGLDLHEQSTMANFFDYDNDGDLDMYLTVNEAASINENRFGKNKATGPKPGKGGKGKLFKNIWDSTLQHGVFKDVSAEAGIAFEGFGHGATVADINRDGWKDIYVSNDFLSENILYINNQKGGFTNRCKEYFKHTSFNSMGQDIIDINNDGLSDVVELDMNPRDNYRKKMMLGASNYNTIQNFELFGSQYQYVRNTLQLNQGPRLLENDSVGEPIFSEIGFMSGIAETDWSWTPLIQDFNNDGFRDMIVTNGFPRDITDHDFIVYRQNAIIKERPMQMMNRIPKVKLANYAFRNTDGLRFTDETADWGLTTPSFSNGAVYADLDNDGDLDMVINNIGDEAFVYKNTSREKAEIANHYIQIKCVGNKQNVNGIGTWIDIYYGKGQHQAFENTPYRGYLSTNQNIAHFGLGKYSMLDSVVIVWQDGHKQILRNIPTNRVLPVKYEDAGEMKVWNPGSLISQPLFKEVTNARGIDYTFKDMDFIDFNIQSTLPHKLSEYRPALAIGDLDGNGLDDMVIGGNSFSLPKLFLQQGNGKFIQKDLTDKKDLTGKNSIDEGVLLFDANGDGSPDMFIATGGYNHERNTKFYQDMLFINDGKGHFTQNETALPANFTSKLCVRAMDYNKDGKLDLFISGRVDPWKYPKPVSCFIYRNDTENGKLKFTDVTDEVAPELKNIGMVCDALFTDFDNDGQTDLIVVGEWMPLSFFKNENGKFKNITAKSGIANKEGWWNTIVAGDFRHTGRTDYIAGNAGLNTLYQASDEHPVYITAKDFDNTGGYVPVTSLFLKDTKGGLQEFPADGRDDILERIPSLRKRYATYNPFATASMNDIFPAALMQGAQRLKASMLQSCFLRNDGDGKFSLFPLPAQAQVSVLNGMVADDFDGDGNLDVLINGNDYGTAVSIGKFDALNGLLLKGNGNGGFSPMSIKESGIYIPGNGKALVKLLSAEGKYMIAASEYKGPLRLFELNRTIRHLRVEPTDIYAIIKYKNGLSEKREFYFGNSFLSQSGRFIALSDGMSAVTITNNKGEHRNINL